MMGIYTNDLNRLIKALDSGLTPNYSPLHIEELRAIDKDASKWKTNYNKAVSLYKELQECYRLSLIKPDGTFDIVRWL